MAYFGVGATLLVRTSDKIIAASTPASSSDLVTHGRHP